MAGDGGDGCGVAGGAGGAVTVTATARQLLVSLLSRTFLRASAHTSTDQRRAGAEIRAVSFALAPLRALIAFCAPVPKRGSPRSSLASVESTTSVVDFPALARPAFLTVQLTVSCAPWASAVELTATLLTLRSARLGAACVAGANTASAMIASTSRDILVLTLPLMFPGPSVRRART